jgi:hypothetical protein
VLVVLIGLMIVAATAYQMNHHGAPVVGPSKPDNSVGDDVPVVDPDDTYEIPVREEAAEEGDETAEVEDDSVEEPDADAEPEPEPEPQLQLPQSAFSAEEVLRAENESLRRTLENMSLAAGKPSGKSANEPEPPLVEGMDDEDFDPATRALLMQQRQQAKQIEYIQATLQTSQAQLQRTQQQQMNEQVVENLIGRIPALQDNANAQVRDMIRQDTLAHLNNGQPIDKAYQIVDHFYGRYSNFITAPKQSASAKVQDALERKRQAEKSTAPPKSASSKKTKVGSNKPKTIPVHGANRFTDMVKEIREGLEKDKRIRPVSRK